METNRQEETEKQKGNIKLENLGTVNKNKVIIETPKGFLALYFSYETIVSFNVSTPTENDRQTVKNIWGTTTGKLLNDCCPDKSKRMDEAPFKEALFKAFNLVF